MTFRDSNNSWLFWIVNLQYLNASKMIFKIITTKVFHPNIFNCNKFTHLYYLFDNPSMAVKRNLEKVDKPPTLLQNAKRSKPKVVPDVIVESGNGPCSFWGLQYSFIFIFFRSRR